VFSKNSNDSSTANLVNGEKRNFLLSGNFSRKVCTSKVALVMLHLPPPVIESFFPRTAFFSMSKTSFPRLAATPAAMRPEAPPPMTMRS